MPLPAICAPSKLPMKSTTRSEKPELLLSAHKYLFCQVGSYGDSALFFTIGTINATAARIHSLNNSFPDTIASLFEVTGGTPKIAWRAKLFGGKEYRGIMRPQGPAGSPNCCEVKRDSSTNTTEYTKCPELSWWNVETGDRSCWETTRKAAAPEMSCEMR